MKMTNALRKDFARKITQRSSSFARLEKAEEKLGEAILDFVKAGLPKNIWDNQKFFQTTEYVKIVAYKHNPPYDHLLVQMKERVPLVMLRSSKSNVDIFNTYAYNTPLDEIKDVAPEIYKQAVDYFELRKNVKNSENELYKQFCQIYTLHQFFTLLPETIETLKPEYESYMRRRELKNNNRKKPKTANTSLKEYLEKEGFTNEEKASN